jgi:hypothetical protein
MHAYFFFSFFCYIDIRLNRRVNQKCSTQRHWQQRKTKQKIQLRNLMRNTDATSKLRVNPSACSWLVNSSCKGHVDDRRKEISDEKEKIKYKSLLQKIWFQFSHCELSIYIYSNIPAAPAYEVYMSFLLWPLCCLSSDLRILIIPLVSANSSHLRYGYFVNQIVMTTIEQDTRPRVTNVLCNVNYIHSWYWNIATQKTKDWATRTPQ